MFHHSHHRHHHHAAGRGGPGAMHHGSPFGPGRRGRHRLFDGGELRLVLLKLIEDQPRHGYDLIREIESLSGGAYAPSPGVVYPTLTLLLDMGLVAEDASVTARKRFAITEEGRAHLAERQSEVEVAMSRLRALADVRSRTDAAPVQRAMHNLKSALHNRLSEQGVDSALILDVAALIDEAASKIERL